VLIDWLECQQKCQQTSSVGSKMELKKSVGVILDIMQENL